ncbi:MAG: hypothetical protein A2014_01575 [Spirochaetes bacterium GWF1_49_6]|nr:MAG: hypothetical protein A2014_01575 [Spirochaetes bacterium GWF1_49_6]
MALKKYFHSTPIISILSGLIFLIALSVPQALHSKTVKASGLNLHKIEQLIFEMTNVERKKAGLPAYQYLDKLGEMALYHSKNMIDNNFFSHTDHKGMSPGQRKSLLFPELLGGVGENIAYNYGSSEQDVAKNLMTAWMNSPGHKANILNTKYSHIGVGIAETYDNGYYYFYATQNFGDLMGELTSIEPEDYSYNDTVTFTFNFLGPFEKKRLTVFVSFPDKSAKYEMPDGSFYTGTGKMTLKWNGDSFSFSIKLKYGKGKYMIMMGKDGSFYPEGYSVTVK